MPTPNPNEPYPLPAHRKLCYLKNIITRPNIIVGDFTYYDDLDDVANFERNVKYHFDFIGDKLVIGKFCAIASGASFIMNGGNHLVDTVSTYPFAIFGGAWSAAMEGKKYPTKGDTVVGNDVWIGHEATIMPGVTIGDGAVVAGRSVVTKNVRPYAIVGGNPAKEIRRRFGDEAIEHLLKVKWWDWPVDRITEHLDVLTSDQVLTLPVIPTAN